MQTITDKQTPRIDLPVAGIVWDLGLSWASAQELRQSIWLERLNNATSRKGKMGWPDNEDSGGIRLPQYQSLLVP